MKTVRTLGYDQPTDDQKDAISSSAQSYTMEVTASSIIAPLTQSCKARLLADILVPALLKRERAVNKLAEERVSACIFASYWPNKTRCDIFLQITQGTWSAISSMWSCIKPEAGVTADLFRPANLFRWNIFASVFVPVFRNLSGFVPGESC